MYNIWRSYHKIPINPLDYAILLKQIMSVLPLEEIERRANKEKNYLKHILESHIKFAIGIKEFQEANTIGIEETCKVLRITKEQYNKYMELL